MHSIPTSYRIKQEYMERAEKMRREEEETLQRRISENKEHQLRVTEKIIRNIKEAITADKKKMEDDTQFYCPAEPSFMVAILIKSKCGISPKPKKTLQLLRLSKINQCVILKNNECIKKMLQTCKDYVAYGYLSYELLRKLIYLRGFGRKNSSKVSLSNENIEDVFEGKYKCVEELLDVIYFGKEDMKKVLNFLTPMNLNCPLGGFKKGRKIKTFIQGGATNNHRELLGDLLERMI
ncbi:hypothetical protein NUSPORA_02888 [Nucleospora cyclopteri]